MKLLQTSQVCHFLFVSCSNCFIFVFYFDLKFIYVCVLFRFRFLFCYVVVVGATHKHIHTYMVSTMPEMPTCTLQSRTSIDIKSHCCMERIDGQQSKWSQCQFCKLVITSVNLWRHIRTQHTEQSPRQCEHCQKKFKNKYSLREHVRIAHEQKPGTATT